MAFSYAKTLFNGATLAISASVGGSASAATTYPGIYDATSVNTGGHFHTIWLVDFLGSSNADRYWQFEGGSGVFTVTDSGASLSGTVVQNTNSGNRLGVAMSFAFRGTGAGGEGSSGPKCGPCGDTCMFDYFDLLSATLTGSAGHNLAGVALDLSVYPLDLAGLPAMPPQMGDGANDKNAGLGFATWFGWSAAAGNTYRLARTSGRGDVNLNLAPVPLPASGLLLFGAIGAIGAVRRKKR